MITLEDALLGEIKKYKRDKKKLPNHGIHKVGKAPGGFKIAYERIYTGRPNSPLCHVYESPKHGCVFCPVFLRTYCSYCGGTARDTIYMIMHRGMYWGRGADVVELRGAINRHIAFLKEILKEHKEKRAECARYKGYMVKPRSICIPIKTGTKDDDICKKCALFTAFNGPLGGDAP